MYHEIGEYISKLETVTAEKERIGAELDVAAKIQTSMLPCIFPPFPNRDEFDIYATMNPAKEVGGDFYDFFMVDDAISRLSLPMFREKAFPRHFFGDRQNADQGPHGV